jgi:hypothetical protein
VIRFPYPSQVHPPAPFVNLMLRNPLTGSELRDVPAQLDTAADRTLLPTSLVQALNLPQIRSIPIGGIGGFFQLMPSYPVLLAIDNLPAQNCEVIADPNEAWVLLGRDVLNAHRILLDGPRLALEIG